MTNSKPEWIKKITQEYKVLGERLSEEQVMRIALECKVSYLMVKRRINGVAAIGKYPIVEEAIIGAMRAESQKTVV